MKIKRVAVENVRSFQERQELILDGSISIIIGPNGGGKTNLLDTVVTVMRKSLFNSFYPAQVQHIQGESPIYEFRFNDQMNQLVLEKHTRALNQPQKIEIDIEVTETDIKNMSAIKRDAKDLSDKASQKYRNLQLLNSAGWNMEVFSPGDVVKFELVEGAISPENEKAAHFMNYLNIYEMDKRVREDFAFQRLSVPLMYFPVTRTQTSFQPSVALSGYNEFELKRSADASTSRSGGSPVQLAVSRMAQKLRLLLEEDKGQAYASFEADDNVEELSNILKALGYEWKMVTVNPLTNEYAVRLSKQGTTFLVHYASSGERELLTYLFVIFGLNVRDALVVVDEPELHLHPKWQSTLLAMFERLAAFTGNQFIFATHSPTFISPSSIQYVSRIASTNQSSKILRLRGADLPEAKHLLSIINSQNNERLFFADAVVLVEGISDRLIFQKLITQTMKSTSVGIVLEVVEVGGKGFFAAYRRLLEACDIPYSIIADFDFLEQVGSGEIKSMFALDHREIKKSVVDDPASIDGATLVEAIEKALAGGDWSHARNLWDYIKSRRISVRKDLTEVQREAINAFIDGQRQGGLHILKRGAIESYLPIGYQGKDLEKIITLCNTDNLAVRLNEYGNELIEICESIWNAHGRLASAGSPIEAQPVG